MTSLRKSWDKARIRKYNITLSSYEIWISATRWPTVQCTCVVWEMWAGLLCFPGDRPDQTRRRMQWLQVGPWRCLDLSQRERGEVRGQPASQPARETKRKINIKNSAVFYGADGGGNWSRNAIKCFAMLYVHFLLNPSLRRDISSQAIVWTDWLMAVI